MLEIQRREALGWRVSLRIHELQLIAATLYDFRFRLGADADPVKARRRFDGAIALDANFKSSRVQCVDQRRIDLQQRFAAGANDVGLRALYFGPERCNLDAEFIRIRKASAVHTVYADKIRVAEFAHGALAVPLVPAPQIASRKPQENGGATGARALALQRVVDLFDLIAHSLT